LVAEVQGEDRELREEEVEDKFFTRQVLILMH